MTEANEQAMQQPQPRAFEDYGFFGPGSPSWKVWTAGTAVVGFQRAVVLEHFDPFLTAAVADQRGIYRDPHGRLDRTFAYFLTVAVADARTAIEASELLMKVHAKATGIEPITGKRYSANNPDSQLWIHVTGWHSVLKCYEMYGPGLTPEEERRYWQECVIAAELQTCKPADVPSSLDEVREYFAEVRPRLCTSERALEGMHYLMYTPRKAGGLKFWAASRLVAPASIASLPMWMRELGGFHRSRLVDTAAIGATSIATIATSPGWARLAVLRSIAPMTSKIFELHHHRSTPANPATITPAEARERSGKAARERADLLLTG